jgi:hypothetical protein
MPSLRLDMFRLGRICPTRGQICPVTRNFMQQKSKSGANMMHLGPDELTISKLDNMKL